MDSDNTPPAAQQDGYNAYLIGEKLEANPNTGTDAEQWAKGWAWARTDHIKANRKALREQQ